MKKKQLLTIDMMASMKHLQHIFFVYKLSQQKSVAIILQRIKEETEKFTQSQVSRDKKEITNR